MPQLYNGFGTWFIGKQNVHNAKDVCPNCHAITNLSSYDTTSYVMALMIPLIPIGKKRVLMECPYCKQFRVAKLAEWNKAKAEAYQEAMEVIQNRMDDQKAVEEALGALIGTQNAAAFDEIAPKVLERWRYNAHMLQCLGDAFAYFDRSVEAVEVYRTSLQITDTEETRECLARELIIAGHPEEALSLMQHIFTDPRDENQPLIQILVHSFQALGQHEEAIQLLGRASETFPATEDMWSSMRKASEKRLAKGTPVLEGYFAKQAVPITEKPARWRFLLAPVLILVALFFYFSAAVDKGKARDIYAVNGLDTPYTMTINGQTLTLRPGSALPFQLPEGSYTVQTSLPAPEQTCEIKTNFLWRTFDDKIFVINPDRCALLLWEDPEYTNNVVDAKYEYEIHTGRLLHEFNRIHYPFTVYPDEIMAEGDTMKKRISVMTDLDWMDTLSIFENNDIAVEQVTFFKRRYHCEPDSLGVLMVLQTYLEPEQFIEEIKAELAQQPVLMETHRVYQNHCEIHYPEKDLLTEYAALMESDSANNDYKYLYSRAVEAPKEAIAICTPLANLEPPHPYATMSLAYHYLAQGRFRESLDMAEKAIAAKPEHAQFQWTRNEAAIALEQFDTLLDDIDRDAKGIPTDFLSLNSSAHYRYRRGDQIDAINKEVADYCAREKRLSDLDRDSINLIKSTIEYSLAYLSGDFEGWMKLSEGEESPRDPLWKALNDGDYKAADLLLDDEKMEGMDILADHVFVYALAGDQGDTVVAEKHFSKMLEFISAVEEKSVQLAGKWLSGEEPFDGEDAVYASIRPDQKHVLLLALGTRFPEHRKTCFALARKLNYNMVYPYYILNKVLDTVTPADAP